MHARADTPHHEMLAPPYKSSPFCRVLASSLIDLLIHIRIVMEMERMMAGCQIPAFGVWNYCSDLPITQYFELAMQARLMKRRNRRRRCGGGDKDVGERLVLFNTSRSPRKPAQIKVIRREVEKQCDGGELQDSSMRGRVADSPMKRMVARAVDEDLYKVPQPLLYQKPRKMSKVVWSLWIGCLGLDCIA